MTHLRGCLLCLLVVTLAGACSFDAGKLRVAATPRLDGATNADTSDATWAGSGGNSGQADTNMAASGGGAGQSDSGDSGNPVGTEVPLATPDGGLDVLLFDGPVLDAGVVDLPVQDTLVQQDAAVQLDTAAWQDTADQPDLPSSQQDVAVSQEVLGPEAGPEAAARLDVSMLDTLVRDTADATTADTPPSTFCDLSNLDLIACYRFEGNIKDESSYGNDGSATNVSYVTGVAGQAVRTLSTSDIVVPTSASLNPTTAITIEIWAQPQTTLATGRAGLVDNQAEYGLFVYPGNSVTCSVGTGAVSASAMLTTGAWTHVACVYDGATLRLYKNGLQAASVAQTGRITSSGTDGLRIGHNNPTGDPFDGAIDGLRIWRVARPAGLLCTQPSCG